MSLRIRLLLAAGAVALGAVLVVDVSTYLTLSASQLKQVDDALATSRGPVEQLARDGSPQSLESIPEIAPGIYVAVVDDRGDVVFETPAARAGDEPIVIDAATLSTIAADGSTGVRTLSITPADGDEVRVRVDPLDGGDALITGQTLHEINETRGRLLRVLVVATLAAVVVIAALGWLLVWLGLRPLREVEDSAREISHGGTLANRVPGADQRTEVGRLAATLNEMLDRIESADTEREQTVADLRTSEARMRRFVADASHELRTPVAATAAYAELFEAGARDRPDDLQRAMTGIQSETARMSTLINDLLLLARLDESVEVRAETVDLTALVLEAVDVARTIDPDRPIHVAVDGVIETEGDAGQVRQVVDNLLANVRAHTPAATPSRVTLSTQDAVAVLEVADDGPGLDPSDLDRMFERFYRADPARTRSTGGSGLGLAIVGSIIEAHGGTVAAERNDPTGLRVIVRLVARTRSDDGGN